MRSQTRPRERRYKPLYPPNRNGCAGHENTRIETYFVRRDLSSSGWADRSAEDRRLRKAEAVGSNPTRSTSPGPSRRRESPARKSKAQAAGILGCHKSDGKVACVRDGCRPAPQFALGGLSRNHDALHARGCLGGILFEIREVTGADVEVNDGGFLLQVDDRLAGLPLHGMPLRGNQFPGTA